MRWTYYNLVNEQSFISMIPKIKKASLHLWGVSQGVVGSAWCGMPTLFTFLTLTVPWGSNDTVPSYGDASAPLAGRLYRLHSDTDDAPCHTAQRCWRISWTSLIVLLSALLFIYEYYLLTEHGTLLTQTVLAAVLYTSGKRCVSLATTLEYADTRC